MRSVFYLWLRQWHLIPDTILTKHWSKDASCGAYGCPMVPWSIRTCTFSQFWIVANCVYKHSLNLKNWSRRHCDDFVTTSWSFNGFKCAFQRQPGMDHCTVNLIGWIQDRRVILQTRVRVKALCCNGQWVVEYVGMSRAQKNCSSWRLSISYLLSTLDGLAGINNDVFVSRLSTYFAFEQSPRLDLTSC